MESKQVVESHEACHWSSWCGIISGAKCVVGLGELFAGVGKDRLINDIKSSEDIVEDFDRKTKHC